MGIAMITAMRGSREENVADIIPCKSERVEVPICTIILLRYMAYALRPRTLGKSPMILWIT